MTFLYTIFLCLIIKVRMRRDRNFCGKNFPGAVFSGTEHSRTDFSLYRIVPRHNSPGQNFPVHNILCTELSWTEFSLYRIFSRQNFPGINFLDRTYCTEFSCCQSLEVFLVAKKRLRGIQIVATLHCKPFRLFINIDPSGFRNLKGLAFLKSSPSFTPV